MKRVGGPISAMWWALVFVAAAGALGLAFSRNDIWTSEVPAAWVQAVGSIAAIAAGFGVAWWEREDAKRERKASQDELLNAIEAAISAVTNYFIELDNYLLGIEDSARIDVSRFLDELPKYSAVIEHYLARDVPKQWALAQLIERSTAFRRILPALEALNDTTSGGNWAHASLIASEIRRALCR